MEVKDQEIEELEQTFPLMADTAFAEARRRVLASGQCVLQAEDDSIFRIHPDGRKVFVKKTEAPTRVVKGAKFRLT